MANPGLTDDQLREAVALVKEHGNVGAAGTWTLTATGPDGFTCLVASGQGFEVVAEALPPNG